MPFLITVIDDEGMYNAVVPSPSVEWLASHYRAREIMKTTDTGPTIVVFEREITERQKEDLMVSGWRSDRLRISDLKINR
jgi:hypothetical protein